MEDKSIEAEKITVKTDKQDNFKVKRTIYYILGILEVLFAFRLVFKVLGANSQSGFVSFIYSFTHIFLSPFIGIFRMAVSDGIETKSVLEPPLLIAMAVYALIAWGIVRLVEIMSNRNNTGNPSI